MDEFELCRGEKKHGDLACISMMGLPETINTRTFEQSRNLPRSVFSYMKPPWVNSTCQKLEIIPSTVSYRHRDSEHSNTVPSDVTLSLTKVHVYKEAPLRYHYYLCLKCALFLQKRADTNFDAGNRFC